MKTLFKILNIAYFSFLLFLFTNDAKIIIPFGTILGSFYSILEEINDNLKDKHNG